MKLKIIILLLGMLSIALCALPKVMVERRTDNKSKQEDD